MDLKEQNLPKILKLPIETDLVTIIQHLLDNGNLIVILDTESLDKVIAIYAQQPEHPKDKQRREVRLTSKATLRDLIEPLSSHDELIVTVSKVVCFYVSRCKPYAEIRTELIAEGLLEE